MAEQQENNAAQYSSGNIMNSKIRDLEEKQRVLKDRLLLIGQNLIESREKVNEELIDIKREMELIKVNMKRLVSFLETASEEFSKFARKEDLEILQKQAKMFQPLEFVIQTIQKDGCFRTGNEPKK